MTSPAGTGTAGPPRAQPPVTSVELVHVLGHAVSLTRLHPVAPVPASDEPTGERDPGRVPVVLVHGIGVSGRYLAPLAAEMGRTSTVLLPDLPGFGASPHPDVPLTIEDHARVLLALIDRAGLDRPILVGHSMGAQVVAEAAVQRPGVASGLVLIGPVTEPGARSALRQAWRLVRDYRHESARTNLITITDWLRTGPRWYLATVPPMIDYPLEDRIAVPDVPILLVRGARDPVAPLGYLERLATRAKKASVVQVPGEGHIVMIRRPGTSAALCRSVLP